MSTGLKDVAQYAGVSISTASRAFSHPETVAKKTREKVFSAAAQLSFSNSRHATVLKSGRSFRIAVLINGSLSHWFNRNVLTGLFEICDNHDYDLSVIPITNDSERQNFLRSLPNKCNVDAVIVVSFNIDPAEKNELDTLGIPIVGIDVPNPETFDASVTVDDEYGFNLALEHLSSLHHRNIAYVQYIFESSLNFSINLRLQEFKNASLQYPQLNVSTISIPPESHNMDYILTKILSSSPNLTALCCQSDDIAIPLLIHLERYGMKVPDDFSVIGFDDNDYAEQVGLTTIQQSPRELGIQAAQLALQLIEHNPVSNPHRHMRAVFRLRDTTGPDLR